MNNDEELYRSHCAPGTSFENRRIVLDNGIELNSVIFTPEKESRFPPLFFFPGFASVIENFRGTMIALTEHFVVHYVETREKPTSKVQKHTEFNVKDIASDISSAIDKAGVQEGNYILLGYSLGATAAAESFNSILKKKPSLLVLIEPSGEFRVPALGLFIAKYFPWTFPLIKPLIKFYIKTFRVNTKEDFEMYAIIKRIIDGADPGKLIPTLIGMAKYRIWDILDRIDVPVLVIGASRDTFHNLDDAKEISSRISNCTYSDLVTNKRSHSPEVCDLLINYLKNNP
jgi:pimeloyl-ACP methyl ester carboxylesterase